MDRDTALITEWVASNIGGTVTSVARQPRWRPVWLVDVARDGDHAGETLELMLRGARVDMEGIWPLDHEMRFQRLLDERGIPVPHVWGWCDAPTGFFTDRVPGTADFAQSTEEQRDAAMREYMGILARS